MKANLPQRSHLKAAPQGFTGYNMFPSPKRVEPYGSGLKCISIPLCKAQSSDFKEILLPLGEVKCGEPPQTFWFPLCSLVSHIPLSAIALAKEDEVSDERVVKKN